VNWYVYAHSDPTLLRDPSGTTAYCQVVFWLGNFDSKKIDPNNPGSTINDEAERDRRRSRLVDAAITAKWIIETRLQGYRVTIYRHGQASDLQRATGASDLVGIATAGHGGCGWFANGKYSQTSHRYAVFNEDYSDQWTWAGAFSGGSVSEGAGYLKLRPVNTGQAFACAYFGHCYSQYLQGTNVLTKGNLDVCHRMYADQLQVGLDKVAHLRTDRVGETDDEQHRRYFLQFHRHLPPCCPLNSGARKTAPEKPCR
jgi:hypothetical protein